MTANACWTSFSSLVMRRVIRTIPCWCRCCRVTAAANPGLRDGGGMLACRCCDRDRVLMDGGATRAAAIAACALVRTRVVVLLVVIDFRICPARRFRRRSRFADLVGMLVGLSVGALVALMVGLLVGLLLSTLGIDVGVVGISVILDCGAGTLGTCCMLSLYPVVVVGSSYRSGRVRSVALVASTIRCRSCVACEALALPVIPCIAFTHSANACITLSAWVMVGLVMCLCWNCTVSESRSLLVSLM